MKESSIKYRIDQAELYLSMLIAFFLPIHQKIISIFILLLALVSIYSWVKQGAKKLSIRYWPFMILFLIYIIGLGFSVNFDYGFKDIETRLTFVLLPLFFGLNRRAKPLNIQYIIYALILGLLIGIIKNYYNAYQCFWTKGYPECFEGTRMSEGMHPTYFAMYLIVGGAFLIILTSKKWKLLAWQNGIIAAISLFFLYMVYRLYSLGAWVGLLGMLTFLLYAYFHLKHQKKFFFVGVLIIAVIGVLAVNNLAFLKKDYNEVKLELSSYFDDPESYIAANQGEPHSINARILIWITSVDFIAEHPFGVGTGDYRDELKAFYRKRNMNTYADRELNSHNQYLQTAAAVGIISSLFLIFSLSYYCYLGFKEKNLYLIALVSLFAVSCLFESVLERQWGILFFMFFLSVFLTWGIEKGESDNELNRLTVNN